MPRLQAKQVGTHRGQLNPKQVGTSPGMVQPKQIAALSPVLVSVVDVSQSTGTVVAGDTLLATATTSEADGITTTGVDLYDGVTRIGAMIQGPTDTWKLGVIATTGTRNFMARRIYAGGTTDSNTIAVTVVGAMSPDQVTTATLLFWGRIPESVQMGGTLELTGTSPAITLTTTSNFIRHEQILVTVTLGGARGVAKLNVFIDDMVTPRMSNVLTAATIAITATDLTLNCPTGTYVLGNSYRSICNVFLDKVGAYPSSTNNFSNAAAGTTRPYIIAAQNNALNVPVVRFDGVNDILTCTGSLGTSGFGGADTKFYMGMIANVLATPSGAGSTQFYCASNTTSVNLPFVRAGMGTSSALPVFSNGRRSDGAVSKTALSNVVAATGILYLEDGFDGTNRITSWNAVNIIGGEAFNSGPVNQSGLTVTTTQVVVGCQQTHSGIDSFTNMDLAEWFIYNQPPSLVEQVRLQAYVRAQYANMWTFARHSDVIWLGHTWDAWDRLHTAGFGISTSMINDPGAPDSITTTYGDRQLCNRDGSNANYYEFNTGNTAAEQARCDDRDAGYVEAGFDHGILVYPNRASVTHGAVPQSSDIWDAGIGQYLATPKGAKLWIVIQDSWAAYDGNSPGTWLNYPAFVADWVALFLNPRYRLVTKGGIANRPVVGLYKSGAPGWDAGHLTTLNNACNAAGLGQPYYIQMNANVTEANALGEDGITSYGPSGATPVGSGQLAYSAQMTKDRSIDLVAGSNQQRVFPITHCNDGRPRGGDPWTDRPIYSEIEQHCRDRDAAARANFTLNPLHLVSWYSLFELDEGGCIGPNVQMIPLGVNSPSRGIYFDAVKNVSHGTFPTTYVDWYHATDVISDLGANPAGWARVQNQTGASGGITGSYKYEVNRNSTNTTPRVLTASRKTNRLLLTATVGAGQGSIDVVVNGGAPTTINLDDGGPVRLDVQVFDSGVITAQTGNVLSVARHAGTVDLSRFGAQRVP
jgi:hypothetical protein